VQEQIVGLTLRIASDSFAAAGTSGKMFLVSVVLTALATAFYSWG